MMEVERMTLNVVIPVLNEEKALRAGVEGDGPVPGWDGGRGRVHHHDRGQRIHGRKQRAYSPAFSAGPDYCS